MSNFRTEIPFYDYKKINPSLELFIEGYDSIVNQYKKENNNIQWEVMHYDRGYKLDETDDVIEYTGWHVAPIMIGDRHDIGVPKVKFFKNAAFLTEISKRVIASRMGYRVGLLSLDPGGEIKWHVDHDKDISERNNTTLLRVLWGLDVPEEEGRESFLEIEANNEIHKHVFKNNEFCIFWSINRHRVVNNLSQKRILLALDYVLPTTTLETLI